MLVVRYFLLLHSFWPKMCKHNFEQAQWAVIMQMGRWALRMVENYICKTKAFVDLQLHVGLSCFVIFSAEQNKDKQKIV